MYDVKSDLEQVGFEVNRQEGSHVTFKHPNGRTAVVPKHGGKYIGKELVKEICKETGLDFCQENTSAKI